MEHELGLQEIYYQLIKAGEKIYEGRLNDEKRQKICIGDVVVFKKDPLREEFFKAEVVDLLHFQSFEAMAESLDAKDLGFKGKTSQQISQIYRKFYSEEKEKKYGVLAIKLKLMD